MVTKLGDKLNDYAGGHFKQYVGIDPNTIQGRPGDTLRNFKDI